MLFRSRWERQIGIRYLFGNPTRKANYHLAVTATVSLLIYLIFLFISLESNAREVVGTSHPELRRSQKICIGGVCYFFALCMAWIVYCSILGI